MQRKQGLGLQSCKLCMLDIWATPSQVRLLWLGEDMQGAEGPGSGGSTCCRTWPEARMPLPYWEDDVGTGVVDGGALEVEGGADEVRAGRVVGGGGGGVGRWKITVPLGLSTAK